VIANKDSPKLVCRVLRFSLLRYLGTISYSLYLLHIPLYYLVLRSAISFGFVGPFADLVVSCVSLVVSIVIASLSWKYFELPVLSLKDRWAPNSPTVQEPIASSIRL
jgi:peptidoglycan/LPS O-acetylase OafA/YrhL